MKLKKPLDPSKAHYRKIVNSEKVYSVLSAQLDNIEPAPPDKIVFPISRTQAHKLVGHERAEAWIYHEDTGCVIKITPGPDLGQSTVGLDGSDRACELAKRYILTEHVEDVGTCVWRLKINALPWRTDVLDLPYPPKWSTQTFSIYVDALVERRRHFGMDQVKDEEGRHHNARIASILVGLFTEPETATSASSSSFETALKFCREHSELSRYSQQIFDAARTMNLPLGVGAYNEELKRHLITKNNKGLDKVIYTMKENHVKPSSDTWTIILQYAESPESRRDALQRCLETGKIVPSEHNRNLVLTLINKEMIDYLAQDNGVIRFMEDMDRLFGETWLTTRALVRMLRICRIKHARVREASELLGEVAKRHDMAEIMDSACLVELVKITKKAGNLRDALEVILSKHVHAQPALYQNILEPLFEFAWLKKSLNLCRLLWIFACTRGEVTFRMKDIMWHSMQGNFDQSLDTETKNWQKVAGKLIISQPRDGDRIRRALPHLFGDDTTTSILTKMVQPTTGIARHEQLQLTQLLIERDIQAWRFFHSIPLVYMRSFLMEFYEMDVALRVSGVWKRLSEESIADQFSAKMPPITLKPRDEPLQYRQADDHSSQRGDFVFNHIPLDYYTLEIDPDAVTAPQKAEAGTFVWKPLVDDEPQSLSPSASSITENDSTVEEGVSTWEPLAVDEPQSLFPLPWSVMETYNKSQGVTQHSEESIQNFNPIGEDSVSDTRSKDDCNESQEWKDPTRKYQSQNPDSEDGLPHEFDDSKLRASVSS